MSIKTSGLVVLLLAAGVFSQMSVYGPGAPPEGIKPSTIRQAHDTAYKKPTKPLNRIRVDTTTVITIKGVDTVKTITITRAEVASAAVDNQGEAVKAMQDMANAQKSFAAFYILISLAGIVAILLI